MRIHAPNVYKIPQHPCTVTYYFVGEYTKMNRVNIYSIIYFILLTIILMQHRGMEPYLHMITFGFIIMSMFLHVELGMFNGLIVWIPLIITTLLVAFI